MVDTAAERKTAPTAYTLVGTLLEACSCGVLCPCWVGEDPDEEACWAFNAYNFTSGRIGGVDVSGRTIINVVEIPGNVLKPASWRVVRIVDDGATAEQRDALLALFRGDLGGPVADLAALTGEEVDVLSLPVDHQLVDGKGTIRVADVISAEMEPYKDPSGTIATTLRDSLFSTVPGSPAYVGKASHHRVNLPAYDMVWEFEGRNAIQSDYRIEYTP